jgi:hypothetical protein
MRLTSIGAAIGLGVALAATVASADPYVKGNDTGGIISWSCEAEAAALAIAADFCASYNKYPRISSVHRQYGDYIAFHCLWSPQIARYQIPAVRTRACIAHALRVRG